jgi:hypothetical protein
MINLIGSYCLAENKDKEIVRNPAQINPNQSTEHIGQFTNGARVERLNAGSKFHVFVYQIIDEKEKVICYAGSSGMSCVPMK